MKKALALLMSCSLLFMGCRHDDFNNGNIEEQTTKTLQGKTIVLNQQQLFSRYENNKVVKDVLNSGFNKNQEGKTTFNESDENPYGVYIDLDHIQVFESEEIHAITYKVDIEGISSESEDGEIKEIFNLVYFSTNKVDYYVTLFRYDFSTIPLEYFIQNPQETNNLLTFLPLKDIENIYENIHSSMFNGMAGKGRSLYYSFQSGDCSVTTVVAGTKCKYDAHEYGDTNCTVVGPGRATPGFSYTTYGPCGGGTGNGGGGSVGSPGHGGGGGGSTPAQPIKANPIKLPVDFVKYPGGRFAQIDLGNNNKNLEVLKGIVDNNLPTLQDLYSKASDTREHGYAFVKIKKNGKYVPLANQTPLPLKTGSVWALNIESILANAINTGLLHAHTNKNTPIYENNKETKAVPMFSHSDLRAIFSIGNVKSMSNKKELYDLFVGLMTSESLYIVMFPNDATKINFQSISNGTPFSYYINSNEIWAEVEKSLRDEYSNITSSTAADPVKAKMYEKTLLKVLKKHNIPLNFYRLDANNGLFNGSWKLLGLDANGNVTENQGH